MYCVVCCMLVVVCCVLFDVGVLFVFCLLGMIVCCCLLFVCVVCRALFFILYVLSVVCRSLCSHRFGWLLLISCYLLFWVYCSLCVVCCLLVVDLCFVVSVFFLRGACCLSVIVVRWRSWVCVSLGLCVVRFVEFVVRCVCCLLFVE